MARLRPPTGLVAVVAQVWQALGSFLLQVIAAWVLGAPGLALVSLCFGLIVVAASISGGVVGDSLTVLDRRDPTIRGGLNAWLLLLVVLYAVAAASILFAVGTLPAWGAVAFAAAAGCFMVEDVLRRVVIARMRFGRLIAIDTVAIAGTTAAVAVVAWLGTTSVTTFLAALAVGQALGVVGALGMLPPGDRLLGRPAVAGMSTVARFGLWRGAQVALTPATQSASRVVLLAGAGAAALGQVEAGRIYVAPALLAVQGYGSYLFARYARERTSSTAQLTRVAVKAAVRLAMVAIGFGALALVLLPTFGPLVSGRSFAIDPVVVAGWSLVAVATAWLQPFASLAATRGAQRRVFQLRLVDAVVAPLALWAALATAQLPPAYAPYVAAGGLALGGALIRRFALGPIIAAEQER